MKPRKPAVPNEPWAKWEKPPEGTDLAAMQVHMHAITGELGPMARWLEDNMPLDVNMRRFIAAYLRGEVKFRVGRRRTFTQINADLRVGLNVTFIERDLGVTRYRALKEYLALDPNMNEETLNGIMSRYDAYDRDRKVTPK